MNNHFPTVQENNELKRALQEIKECCDRDWEDEDPMQVAHIVSNAMWWRNEEIVRLRERIAELEASK